MLWTCYISVAPVYQPAVLVNKPSCMAGNGGMEEVDVCRAQKEEEGREGRKYTAGSSQCWILRIDWIWGV